MHELRAWSFNIMAHNTHTCDIQLSCYITGCDVAQSHNHLGRSADDRTASRPPFEDNE